MKKKLLLLLMLFICAFCAQSYAQQWEKINPTQPNKGFAVNVPVSKSIFAVPAGNFKIMPVKTIEHWYKLKRFGQFLTFFGIGCIAGGTALVVVGSNENDVDFYYNNTSGVYSTGDEKIIMGALGIAGGITAVGGGIPMWVIGAKRINKYERSMGIKPGKQSIGLVYNF